MNAEQTRMDRALFGQNLVELRRTCPSHPAQWIGETGTGSKFYARYRFGRLRWGFAVRAAMASDGLLVGPSLDGEMEQSSMLRHSRLFLEPRQ
jgi:hypothetical protein